MTVIWMYCGTENVRVNFFCMSSMYQSMIVHGFITSRLHGCDEYMYFKTWKNYYTKGLQMHVVKGGICYQRECKLWTMVEMLGYGLKWRKLKTRGLKNNAFYDWILWKLNKISQNFWFFKCKSGLVINITSGKQDWQLMSLSFNKLYMYLILFNC